MKAQILEKIQPAEYLHRFLAKKLRPDGRAFLESRDIAIKRGVVSTAVGSAQVALGSTIVTCGIKAEVSTPTWDAPKSGFIVVNADMPPLSHSTFRPGPPNEETQSISHYINSLLARYSSIDLSGY